MGCSSRGRRRKRRCRAYPAPSLSRLPPPRCATGKAGDQRVVLREMRRLWMDYANVMHAWSVRDARPGGVAAARLQVPHTVLTQPAHTIPAERPRQLLPAAAGWCCLFALPGLPLYGWQRRRLSAPRQPNAMDGCDHCSDRPQTWVQLLLFLRQARWAPTLMLALACHALPQLLRSLSHSNHLHTPPGRCHMLLNGNSTGA